MTEEDDVRRFIVEELGWTGPVRDLTPDFPLLETEAVDSLGMYQLATWLEDRYGVEIAAEEFVPAHFGTIRGIAELVRARRGA